MKEEETRLGKCNKIPFPHKFFNMYMTGNSKNIRLAGVSLCVDVVKMATAT